MVRLRAAASYFSNFPPVQNFPDKSERYLARVVGLPGETIEIRGHTIYINGRLLDEQKVMAKEDADLLNPLIEVSTDGNGPYRVYYTEHVKDPESEAPGDFATNNPFQIPNDSFFVLGDNRDNSVDSRHRGPVPRELIWGKASIIYYSEAGNVAGSIRSERLFKRVQ